MEIKERWSEMRRLMVRVKEIKGFCDIMKVGDYFTVDEGKLSIPENPYFCYWALNSILPLLPAKQRKIDESGDWLPVTWEVECPDPKGQVIMEIIPLEEEK